MNELILELEEITPKEFFGPQNTNIELFKKHFPKLKIVARGNKIKAYGDEDLLEEEKEDVKLKKQGGAEAEDTSRKRDTVKDNSHAILGDEPTKEEIDRIIEILCHTVNLCICVERDK